MGPEALLYTYLAGQGVKMVGDHRAKVERNQILHRSMEDADRTQGKAIDTVQGEAAQMNPMARQQAMTAAESAIQQRTMGDIAGAGGAAVDTSQGAGAVSTDFTRARDQRSADESSRLSAMVAQLAKTRAPGEVATQEAQRRSSIAEQLGSLWSGQKNRAQAAELDANAVDTPWWGTAGQLAATAAGAAYLGGAGGAAPGAAEVSGMDMAADAPIGAGNNVGGVGAAPGAWYTRPRPTPRMWGGR